MMNVTFTVAGFGCKQFTGASISELSSAWSRLLDESGVGASCIKGFGPVIDGTRLVGWMSYNGRVWPRRDWQPGDVPVGV